MITAGVIPDTRHRLIGREIDIIRCRIEETSIPIGDTSDMIDGTGDETRDTTVILAAIKQSVIRESAGAKFRPGALAVDGCCRWRL